MNSRRMIATAVGGAFTLTTLTALAALPRRAAWPSAGQNLHNTRNQAAEVVIGPLNAGRLAVKWVFETGGDVSATPAVDHRFVYVPDSEGNLFKIEKETGTQVWRHTIGEYTGIGVDRSRTSPALAGNLLILGDHAARRLAGARVLAVDKDTGARRWVTKVDDHRSAVVTQSPVVADGRVYVGVSSHEELHAAFLPRYRCCSFRGSLVALDANTGQILWKTYLTPGAEHPGYTGVAVWGGTPVVDTKRQSVYVTTGNDYTVPQAILDCAALGDETQVRACVASVPGSEANHFDSIVALNMWTGEVRWARSMVPFDAYTIACLFSLPSNKDSCPSPAGPDFDFGQGPMLFEVSTPQTRELLGAGQKSGIFWAVDPDDGSVVWSTRVGPGGKLGGMQWGSATDGQRIYAAVSNSGRNPWPLPSGEIARAGFWSALDPATGAIVWQSPGTPAVETMNQGPVTVANGVVYAGTLDKAGTMYALDAATGNTLWTFQSGGAVNSGPAVVDGVVYWGSGYSIPGVALSGNNKLYAFHVPPSPAKTARP
jgi:polyvinyl alcohol dehydrogenase (cytochrome)